MVFATDIQAGINNIKSALAEGLPVMFCIALGKNFFDLVGPLATQHYSLVDIPGYRPITGNTMVGGHAMTIVGNSDTLGGFIVENQWGTAWGDNGYCLIPYNVIQDFSEAWVIRGYKDIDLVDPVKYAAQMQVVKLYASTLNRAPELSGFKWWVDKILSGAPLNSAAQGFLNSDECRSHFTDDGQVVCDIIYNIDTFNNKVKVGEYFAIDLACDKLNVAKTAFSLVTADIASVDIAKKAIRTQLGGGVL
jgi:hypothetical protein